MASPVWQLRIDWSNTGLYNHPNSDVTSRVIGDIVCYRGRDVNAVISGTPTPGRLRTRLNNTTGDYSFWNAGGPLQGNLLPGALVNLRAVWQGTTYDRWTGYLLTKPTASVVGGIPIVDIEAEGAFAYIDNQDVDLPAQVSAATNEIINAILQAAGFPTANRDVQAGRTRLRHFLGSERRKKPTQLLQDVNATEAGQMFEGRDGKIVTHNRHFLPENRTSRGTYSDEAAMGALNVSAAEHEDPLETVFSEFTADADSFRGLPTDEMTPVRLWEHDAAEPLSINPGDSATFEARFTPSGDFVGVRDWEAPVLVVNSSPTGQGRDMAADVTIDVVERFLSARITLTNTHATDLANVISLTIDGVRLQRVSSSSITKRSATLQQSVDQRQHPSRPKFNSPDEAQRWGEWQRALFESPQPILTITVPSFRDDAHLTAALQRDISDRVTVRLRGDSVIGVDQDFFIERVADEIAVDGNMTTIYSLISAEPYNQWAVADLTTSDDHLAGW